jgi:hypothetical protein
MIYRRTPRQEREEASKKFRPAKVELLLVAEAPPKDPGRYFYFPNVTKHDGLFRGVVRALLGEEPTRDNKRELLNKLRDQGVYLIDLKFDPVDGSSLAECVPDLVQRSLVLKPKKVVLIKVTVYDAAFACLREAGLPVVDERIPFPGSGHQREFEAAFRRAMKHTIR